MESVYISELPKLSIKTLSRLNLLPDPETEETRTGVVVSTISRLAYSYQISYSVCVCSDGRGGGSLAVSFTTQGERREFQYCLKRKESNLGKGRYFVMTGNDGREFWNLYLCDGYFVPRYCLGRMEYQSQAMSDYWRGIEKLGSCSSVEPLFRKGGKVYYRNSLTAYGRKLLKYYGRINRYYTLIDRPDRNRRRTLELLDYIVSPDPE